MPRSIGSQTGCSKAEMFSGNFWHSATFIRSSLSALVGVVKWQHGAALIFKLLKGTNPVLVYSRT